MTFTKTELALVLMSQLDFSRLEARKFVCTFFDKINQVLCSGEAVRLSGIGNFTLRNKNSRPGRNPKTKENIPVTARRVVTFQASQTLKKKISLIWDSFNKSRTAQKKSTRKSIPKVTEKEQRVVALETVQGELVS